MANQGVFRVCLISSLATVVSATVLVSPAAQGGYYHSSSKYHKAHSTKDAQVFRQWSSTSRPLVVVPRMGVFIKNKLHYRSEKVLEKAFADAVVTAQKLRRLAPMPLPPKPGQDNPAHSKPSKADSDKTGKDETGKDKTGKDKTGKDKTGQDKTGKPAKPGDSEGSKISPKPSSRKRMIHFKAKVPSIRPAKDEPWLRVASMLGGSGNSLDEVPHHARTRAKRKYSEMIQLARAEGITVSDDTDNFRFDYKGSVVGWIAPSGIPDGEKLPIELVKQIKGGANSDAFFVKSKDSKYKKFGMLKVMRPLSPRREPETATGETLIKLGNVVVKSAQMLRASSAFKQVAGDIVPDVMILRPGLILQEKGKGVDFDSLADPKLKRGKESSKQKFARKRIKEITAAARKVLGSKLVLSPRTQNFLYDPATGLPTCWFDHISDGKKTYRKKRKQRVLEVE